MGRLLKTKKKKDEERTWVVGNKLKKVERRSFVVDVVLAKNFPYYI